VTFQKMRELQEKMEAFDQAEAAASAAEAEAEAAEAAAPEPTEPEAAAEPTEPEAQAAPIPSEVPAEAVPAEAPPLDAVVQVALTVQVAQILYEQAHGQWADLNHSEPDVWAVIEVDEDDLRGAISAFQQAPAFRQMLGQLAQQAA
jgi:hypothetical protein